MLKTTSKTVTIVRMKNDEAWNSDLRKRNWPRGSGLERHCKNDEAIVTDWK